MHLSKIVTLFFILCSCYSLTTCDEQVSLRIQNLQCHQYANDLDILSRFPFTVSTDYKQQGPGKSTAILDSTNTSVVMIQLRQTGGIVPESVFCLKKLQSLDIMNMFFVDDTVPDSLSNLQELHSIGMTNTPIRRMTETLGSLQKLQSLTLDKCSLKDLPNLSGLLKLRRLSLPNNQLTKLEGLQEVSSLLLYKNLFTELPTLAEPEALRMLNMNYNPVLDMSNITAFRNMTDLRLSETFIPAIPPEINELEYLNFLDLAHTRITHVPRTVLKMPYLRYLVVQRNPIPQEEVDAIKQELSSQQSKITLLI